MNTQDKLAEKVNGNIYHWFYNNYHVTRVPAGYQGPVNHKSSQVKLEWDITIEEAKEGWSWVDRLDSAIKTQIIIQMEKYGIHLMDEVYVSDDPVIMFDHPKFNKSKKIGFYGWIDLYTPLKK